MRIYLVLLLIVTLFGAKAISNASKEGHPTKSTPLAESNLDQLINQGIQP